MSPRLPLILARDGDRILLRSPEVGTFTQALRPGTVVTPDLACGSLRQLSLSFDLRAPDGVLGRVISPRPERIHHPVSHGDVLYELAPIEAGDALHTPDTPMASESGAPAMRAPYSGRYWHRPSPQDPAFVSVGAVLEAGATVGLLEVMKTFTQLTYTPGGSLPARAKITRLVAADGDEVAEGAALFEVEPA